MQVQINSIDNLQLPKSCLKEIDDAINEYTKNIIEDDLNKTFNNFLNSCITWENDYYKIYFQLSNAIKNAKNNQIKRKIINTDKEQRTSYTFKGKISTLANYYTLHLKKGYALIQKLRFAISKLPIDYRILISVENSQINEKIFSLEEILKKVTFSDTEIYKAVMLGEDITAKLSKISFLNEENVQTTNAPLYTSLVNYFSMMIHNKTQEIIKGRHFKEELIPEEYKKGENYNNIYFNRGRVYELYVTLLNNNIKDNNYEVPLSFPNNDPFEQYLVNYYYQHRAENIAFYKQQGDVNGQELKNVSHSDAQLFSANTVIKVITSLRKDLQDFIFNFGNRGSIAKTNLQKTFTSTHKLANKEYNNKINTTFDYLFLNNIT